MKKKWAAPQGRMLRLAYELGILSLVCGITLLMLRVGAGFETSDSNGIRTQAIVIAVLPAVLAYVLLRCLWSRTTSAFVALSAVLLLTIAHAKKMALTGAPLSWNDVATVKNLRVASSYFSVRDWVILAIFAALLCAMPVYLFMAGKRPSIKSLVLKVAVAAPIAMVCLYPYVTNARLDTLVARAGISYISWDWPGNIKHNGLLMHLVHTSVRPVPPNPSNAEVKQFATLPLAPLPFESPQHIFFILCESCWNDSTHFADVFKPLEDQGVRAMRAISPVYGGGTVNSTFEMLTALPVEGPLSGVLFQEYGRVFSDHAKTIVSSLREAGYKTFALHNYHGDFWQRNVVLPKFGFDRFVSLEQMHYEGDEQFPRDALLFDQALSLLRDHRNESAFFSLETVHTHGPYEADGDMGEHRYKKVLSETAGDLARFVQEVSEISPNALFVIYGDHKPSMNRFFLNSGVFEPKEFAQTGPSDSDFIFSSQVDAKKVGDVPVWIGFVGKQAPAGDALHDFRLHATHKPFFCLSAAISYFLLPTQDPASRFVEPKVCRTYKEDMQRGYRAPVPAWLYSASLFDVDLSRGEGASE